MADLREVDAVAVDSRVAVAAAAAVAEEAAIWEADADEEPDEEDTGMRIFHRDYRRVEGGTKIIPRVGIPICLRRATAPSTRDSADNNSISSPSNNSKIISSIQLPDITTAVTIKTSDRTTPKAKVAAP